MIVFWVRYCESSGGHIEMIFIVRLTKNILDVTSAKTHLLLIFSASPKDWMVEIALGVKSANAPKVMYP